MSRTLLSLCLCGAALAIANILIVQRPTCPLGRALSAAADKAVPSTITDVVSTAKGKPPQASKAAVLSTASSEPPEAKRPQAERPAANPPAPAPKHAEVTGSVKQTAKTQNPAPVSQGRLAALIDPPAKVEDEPEDQTSAPVSQDQLAALIDPPTKVEDEPEEWADVTLAARAHDAPSVSAPIVRYYRLGTRLKVVGRESGWIKVVDPTTSKGGWIYEKYLTTRKGRDQKSAQAESELPNDPNIAASPQGGSDARHYRPRKSGWKWSRWRRSAVGFAINVYPRW